MVDMKKMIGKDIDFVKPKLQTMNITNIRIVNQNGLVTADYDPSRYTIEVDSNGIITDVEMG